MKSNNQLSTESAPPCSTLMARALQLAQGALYHTSPNPRVGCIIVDASGQILGKGQTQVAGQAHAEVMAIRDAIAKGHNTQGATAYVTLEPCSHFGRTGPCCDALIEAGIKRVVASTQDPNPLVAGQGFQRLRAAGVDVMVGDGAQQSKELNIGFFSRMQRKRPWMRMKMAISLDGQTGLENGQSQWITSEQARTDGHAWRARACAILTGAGTVIQDKPLLDVRLVPTQRQPQAILIDSRLDCDVESAFFNQARPYHIFFANASPEKQKLWQEKAKKSALPWRFQSIADENHKVNLELMLEQLSQLELNEIHVEAGHKLNGSLLRHGLIDELLIYMAPKLIGKGQPLANLPALENLSDATPLVFHSVQSIGPDLRIVARIQGKDDFLSA